MGRSLLIYKGQHTPLEYLSIYRDRDGIEKAFRTLKTDMDILPIRIRNELTIRGMLSTSLMNRYSLERMLLELKKPHVVEDSG
jgi:transposase